MAFSVVRSAGAPVIEFRGLRARASTPLAVGLCCASVAVSRLWPSPPSKPFFASISASASTSPAAAAG
ncbi:hypothetical protein BHE74_00020437 [Ensete ventricosum]|uniref:Uncharacterized protein n=1 Tax=Ensete ventricosum TaxID=4639 RepID=A0A426ZX49_ENSVE|nr:hypothetical protein B296_00007288 [Ensete ventricosum]RWV88979.1 hypothetical protein GW17_00048897 [Ensete ventricosum]RWW71791.1 hypothetical protein BHE74_00020437 [Ensete ventricosum]